MRFQYTRAAASQTSAGSPQSCASFAASIASLIASSLSLAVVLAVDQHRPFGWRTFMTDAKEHGGDTKPRNVGHHFVYRSRTRKAGSEGGFRPGGYAVWGYSKHECTRTRSEEHTSELQ